MLMYKVDWKQQFEINMFMLNLVDPQLTWPVKMEQVDIIN